VPDVSVELQPSLVAECLGEVLVQECDELLTRHVSALRMAMRCHDWLAGFAARPFVVALGAGT